MSLTNEDKKKLITLEGLQEFLRRLDIRYRPVASVFTLEQVKTGTDASGVAYDDDYFALNLVFNKDDGNNS